jgi:galactokinase
VRLGLDLDDTKNTFPKQYNKRRQIVADAVAELDRRRNADLAKRQDSELAAVCKKLVHLEKKRGQFIVILPRKSADFIREGKSLHNCLGDGHYVAKMVRGETVVAFIRRSNKPAAAYAAVEYSRKERKVLQCYLAKNQRPPKPVLTFVNKVFNVRRAA